MPRLAAKPLIAIAVPLLIAVVVVVVVLVAQKDHNPTTPHRPLVTGTFSYDPNRPLNATVTDAGTKGAVTLQDIDYDGFDGQRVPGLLVSPLTGDAQGCLILQPELGATKESLSFLWDGLAAAHLTIFSIDPRDSGARVADPKAALTAAVKDPTKLRELLVDSVRDLRRGIDELENRGVCNGHIAFLGVSLGGALATMTAGSDPRVDAVVLVSTGPSWARGARVDNPLVLPGYAKDPAKLRSALEVLSPVDPARWLRKVPPRPIMVINGRSDPLIPTADQRVLAKAAGPTAEILHYDGGHDPYHVQDGGVIGQKIATFLAKFLAADGGG